MNPFFDAQFNYCPLIWMVHSRTNNIIWLDIFMRDALMNFWGGIIQFLYIIEIYKVWQLRSLKLRMKCLQKLLVIFLRKELIPLHEKRSDTKVFLVRIQENTDQKNFLFGHFSRSVLAIFPETRTVLEFFYSIVYKMERKECKSLTTKLRALSRILGQRYGILI